VDRQLGAPWQVTAGRQAGLITRRQLRVCGVTNEAVDAQLNAQRWRLVSGVVVATATGLLTRRQLMWAGVLHGGPRSSVGGLTALEVLGLRNWQRPEVTVLVEKSHNLEPLAGVAFVETRRPLEAFRGPWPLPMWQVEPAALLFAAYEPVTRTAYGLLAAIVQQRLSNPYLLQRWIDRMRPLRRAKAFAAILGEIGGGAQSLAELDLSRMCRRHHLPLPVRQTPRPDSSGRMRFTDAEWRLADGRVVVLEVDGSFHMDVGHWSDDLERERDLVAGGAIVLRCTARQLREDDGAVARDLRRVGVGQSSA
jgi:hypothetical protein